MNRVELENSMLRPCAHDPRDDEFYIEYDDIDEVVEFYIEYDDIDEVVESYIDHVEDQYL